MDLDRIHAVGVFPELSVVGLYRARASLQRKHVLRMLAIEAGLSIVPLSIVGTRHVMRKGRLTVAPGDVTLAVHPPIDAAARAEHPSIDDARELAAEVHAIISGRVEAIERARGAGPGTLEAGSRTLG